MFKLIKWLLIIAIVAVIAWQVSGKRVSGKRPSDYTKAFAQSKFYKETLRDVRTIVGESFKAVGSAISDDVTEADSEALKNIIKQDMKGNEDGGNKKLQD